MYRLCALKYPYETKTFYQIAKEILSDSKFPRIPNLYSNELNYIIHLMLIKDYDKRPSVAQILEMQYFQNFLSIFNGKNLQENLSFSFKNKSFKNVNY